MRALLAIDSFKGSLSSSEAEEAAREALLGRGLRTEDICCIPVSDGGEGFCSIVTSLLGGRMVEVSCFDPLGRPVKASYGIVDDGHTAVIESASAVGLGLIKPSLRNPLVLSSYGLGQMIADAISRKVWDIYVGLGGTATCDGGVGMLQALGVHFYCGGPLKEDSQFILSDVTRIDASELFSNDVRIHCLCDTSAVFYGQGGSARVFGPQKGLSPEKAVSVDNWMKRLSKAYAKATGRDPQAVEGSGAAGGIGGALCSFMGAEMLKGARGVLSLAGFERHLKEAAFSGKPYDIIITGEGCLDAQTLTGKLPWTVLGTVRELEGELPEFHPQVICLAGKVQDWTAGGFDRVVQITPSTQFSEDGAPDEEALRNARKYLMSAVAGLEL